MNEAFIAASFGGEEHERIKDLCQAAVDGIMCTGRVDRIIDHATRRPSHEVRVGEMRFRQLTRKEFDDDVVLLVVRAEPAMEAATICVGRYKVGTLRWRKGKELSPRIARGARDERELLGSAHERCSGRPWRLLLASDAT